MQRSILIKHKLASDIMNYAERIKIEYAIEQLRSLYIEWTKNTKDYTKEIFYNRIKELEQQLNSLEK